MLWCMYGKTGVGKTHFGMQDYVIAYIKLGYKVATNIKDVSIAGVSGYAHVVPTLCRITPFKTLQELLSMFDNSDEWRNSLFVVDEIQQLVKTEQQADWLFQRLAIMRKQNCDFLFITQAPGKIPPLIRDLVDGCSLLCRAYSFGSGTRVFSYNYNCGTPKMANDKPVDYDSMDVRQLDSRIFNCYQSYIDDAITGGCETEKGLARTTRIWASSKAKRLYLALAIPVIFLVVGYIIVTRLFGAFASFGDTALSKAKETAYEAIVENSSSSSEFSSDSCYTRLKCGDAVCQTDIGVFTLAEYDSDNDYFVRAGRYVGRCEGSFTLRQ